MRTSSLVSLLLHLSPANTLQTVARAIFKYHKVRSCHCCAWNISRLPDALRLKSKLFAKSPTSYWSHLVPSLLCFIHTDIFSSLEVTDGPLHRLLWMLGMLFPWSLHCWLYLSLHISIYMLPEVFPDHSDYYWSISNPTDGFQSCFVFFIVFTVFFSFIY